MVNLGAYHVVLYPKTDRGHPLPVAVMSHEVVYRLALVQQVVCHLDVGELHSLHYLVGRDSGKFSAFENHVHKEVVEFLLYRNDFVKVFLGKRFGKILTYYLSTISDDIVKWIVHNVGYYIKSPERDI